MEISAEKLMVKLEHADIIPENDIIDVIDDIHCPRFETNSYKKNDIKEPVNEDMQIINAQDLQFNPELDIPGLNTQMLAGTTINNQINYVGVFFGSSVKNLSNLTVLFMTIIFTVVYLGAYIYGFKVY